MYHNHNELIAQAREWIAYLKKSAKHPSGNLGDLLKAMIEDAVSGHARIEELEKKISHALSDEKKITIKVSKNAKLPD